MKNSTIKPIVIALACVLYWPQANAEVVNETWIVRSGDGLYNIARKLAPQDLQMQARIRNEIVQLNPDINTGSLEIGTSLKLPEFLFKKSETPAPVKSIEPPAPTQISKAVVTPDPEEVVGRVVIQSGNMVAVNRGSSRKLNRTSNILKGDTLKTASNTRSQIRLKDGALIALSPDTELKIEEFAYNGSEDGSERSVLNLIKGGFRTITGAIGHINKQNYQVRTSVATIGIRGTHYGLMLCEAGSCQNPNAGNLSDGLYGGVVDGSIVTENTYGTTTFNNDQFFYIQTAQTPPVETLVPPPIFQDTSQPGNNQNRPDDSGNDMIAGEFFFDLNPLVTGDTANPIIPPKDIQVVSGNQGNTTLPSAAPSGSGMAIAFTNSQSTNNDYGVAVPIAILSGKANSIFLQQDNNLPAWIHEEHTTLNGQGIPVLQVHNAYQATATYADLGGNSKYGVNWGQWNGNYTINENGNPLSHDSIFHFIYSDQLTSTDTLATLGGLRSRLELYTFAGGTHPTHSDPAVTLTLAQTYPEISMTVDFLSHAITSYDVDIVSARWHAWLPSPVDFSLLDDGFNLVADLPSPSYAGRASVMFIGGMAEGAITSYSIFDTTAVGNLGGISGAALLLPPGSVTPDNSALLVASNNINTALPSAIPFIVQSGSQDNIYIGQDANGTKAPVAALDIFSASNLPPYHSLTVNPSVATATVNTAITDTILTNAGVTAYWGRWDSATVSLDAATSFAGTTYFIGSNSLTTPTQLAGLTGNLNYIIANGGTAYDANLNGLAATSANVNMTANFSAQQITAYSVTVNITGASITGEMRASNPVNFSQLNQGFNLVDFANCTGCLQRGTASLAFVGPQAQGALTSFSLSNGVDTAAGVALLTQ